MSVDKAAAGSAYVPSQQTLVTHKTPVTDKNGGATPKVSTNTGATTQGIRSAYFKVLPEELPPVEKLLHVQAQARHPRSARPPVHESSRNHSPKSVAQAEPSGGKPLSASDLTGKLIDQLNKQHEQRLEGVISGLCDDAHVHMDNNNSWGYRLENLDKAIGKLRDDLKELNGSDTDEEVIKLNTRIGKLEVLRDALDLKIYGNKNLSDISNRVKDKITDLAGDLEVKFVSSTWRERSEQITQRLKHPKELKEHLVSAGMNPKDYDKYVEKLNYLGHIVELEAIISMRSDVDKIPDAVQAIANGGNRAKAAAVKLFLRIGDELVGPSELKPLRDYCADLVGKATNR